MKERISIQESRPNLTRRLGNVAQESINDSFVPLLVGTALALTLPNPLSLAAGLFVLYNEVSSGFHAWRKEFSAAGVRRLVATT